MNISEINPHIRYAKEQKRQANYRNTPLLSMDYSRNYDARLFYFISGSGWLESGEKKYNISNNTVVYLPPASRYRFFFGAESEYRAIVINFDFTQELSYLADSLKTVSESAFLEDRVSSAAIPEEFADVIVREGVAGDAVVRCAEEFLTKRYLYRESASAELKSFLIELIRERNEVNFELVKNVIEYVRLHYPEQDMSNQSIAAHLGYHPYHISKLMRVATGKPLKQYVLYYRIQMAKKELIATDAGIEEISWRCGFSSSAHFIKLFRELCGITPKKYRDTNKASLL